MATRRSDFGEGCFWAGRRSPSSSFRARFIHQLFPERKWRVAAPARAPFHPARSFAWTCTRRKILRREGRDFLPSPRARLATLTR